MISLTADGSWLLKDLGKFIEPVEVYDSTGKLLGLFVPANLERCKQIEAEVIAKIDRAEIERRMQSKEKGITMEETLKRLDKLKAEIQRRQAQGEPALTTEQAIAFCRSLRAQVTGQSTNHAGDETVRRETDQCSTL